MIFTAEEFVLVGANTANIVHKNMQKDSTAAGSSGRSGRVWLQLCSVYSTSLNLLKVCSDWHQASVEVKDRLQCSCEENTENVSLFSTANLFDDQIQTLQL